MDQFHERCRKDSETREAFARGLQLCAWQVYPTGGSEGASIRCLQGDLVSSAATEEPNMWMKVGNAADQAEDILTTE